MAYGSKKCAHCDQPATHKITKVADGKILDLYLCAEHAAASSPWSKPKTSLNSQLSSILEQLLKDEQPGMAPVGPSPADLRCAHCGLRFREYKRNLMLGCSECYESFRTPLQADLLKMHGDTRHVGRCPGGGRQEPVMRVEGARVIPVPGVPAPQDDASREEDIMATLELLDAQMKDAIAREDFTQAQRCLQRIKDLRRETAPEVSQHNQPQEGDL